jgi:F0F1-type ATP synthase assembly protein I
MANKSVYTRVGRLSAIITILPAAMAAGWLMGYFLVDRWFGTFPWGTILLLFLGAGAGFYEIYKILTVDSNDSPSDQEH